MDKIRTLLDKIKCMSDDMMQDDAMQGAILTNLTRIANRHNIKGLELKKHYDYPTLEEAIHQVEMVYCKANEEEIIYLLEDLIKTCEMPDSEVSDDLIDSDIFEMEVESEEVESKELEERLERLENVDDDKVILLLETIISKYSKEVIQEDVHTATRTRSAIINRLDAMITYTIDEKERKELFSYLDALITNLDLSSESKELEVRNEEYKKNGGHGHVVRVMRGEVYWASITRGVGKETSGRRPVLIVSNDGVNNNFQTVNVVMLTSRKCKNGQWADIKQSQVEILNSHLTYGTFSKRGLANVLNIFTIDKVRLLEHFATVNNGIMKQIDEKLCEQLAISEDACKSILEEKGYTVTK